MSRTSAASVVASVALAFLAACGSDSKSTATTPVTSSPASTSSTVVTTTTPSPQTTAATPTTVTPTTVTPTTVTPTTVSQTTVSDGPTTTATTTVAATTTTVAQPAQPAIWPAAGAVFATPEAAATDFMLEVFGVSPTFGAFEQGDSRSGEIAVLLGEGSSPPTQRSTLVLRQLAPDDGWFVLSAVNDSMTIDSPVALSEVSVGQLQVSGTGRGFEALIVVEAFIAGNTEKLDTQIAMGGSAETPEPFSVSLDVSSARSGDTVVVLIRGGVGLENDPGEFSALALTVID